MTTVQRREAGVEPVDRVDAPRRGDAWDRLKGPASYVLVIVVQFAVIWPVAMKRAFDGDEGFYAIAAKLVAHGGEPYFDFWFQYTPGLPYVYGTWTRIAGESFESLRALSALLTIALGVLLFAHVSRRFSRRLGFVAVALYIASSWVFSWYSTYKSYALSTLLLFAAYVLIARTDRDEPCGVARWFVAGALLGLAVDVRLYFIALVPVFAYYAMGRRPWRRARLTDVVTFAGGLIVGLLPCIYFFARDPERFFSDTVLSQNARSDLSLIDSMVQKLRTVDSLLDGAQFLILVGAALALTVVVFATRPRRRVPLALAIAGGLALTSLFPTPTFDQYFSVLVPFLVIGAVDLWHTVGSSMPSPPDPRVARLIRPIGIVGLALFIAAGVSDFDAMMNTNDTMLDPPGARAISEAIDAHTRDGEMVVDFAPIDLYESHAELMPELAGNFATPAAMNLDLSDREAARYKMITIGRLERLIRSGGVRTVIAGPYDSFQYPRPWPSLLEESGYVPVATVNDRTIYQLPSP